MLLLNILAIAKFISQTTISLARRPTKREASITRGHYETQNYRESNNSNPLSAPHC